MRHALHVAGHNLASLTSVREAHKVHVSRVMSVLFPIIRSEEEVHIGNVFLLSGRNQKIYKVEYDWFANTVSARCA